MVWYRVLVPFPFSCLLSNSGSSYHYKFLVMCWDEVCFPVPYSLIVFESLGRAVLNSKHVSPESALQAIFPAPPSAP